MLLWGLGWLWVAQVHAQQPWQVDLPELLPPAPHSSFLPASEGEPDVGFCSRWNPEWGLRGHGCCGNRRAYKSKIRTNRCSPRRWKSSFCDEMTEEQREYSRAALNGELGDLLDVIVGDLNRRIRNQAQCNVNNGFLAWGRRLIPSEQNRVRLRTPFRCTDFGTDGMVGMLEWLGREVAERYSGPEYERVHLLVGDISAPRGGCLSGRYGRRGHLSHTSGLDVDLGFLHARPREASPLSFTRKFDAEVNGWFLRRIFQNPFACVKMVLLDHRHIRRLERELAGDPYWAQIRPFVKHARHHRNHFHVRLGEIPGAPGCDTPPETFEEEEEGEGEEPSGEDAAEESGAQLVERLWLDTDRTPATQARPLFEAVTPLRMGVGPRAYDF
jgi:murein endopeptidase